MNKSFLKFLTDFGPLVIFFYYYYDSEKDLKIAIPPFIIATIIALTVMWFLEKRIPKVPLLSGVLITFFGGLTIYFDNPVFIYIKPTIINILFGLALIFGKFFTNEPVLKKLMGKSVSLTNEVVTRAINKGLILFWLLYEPKAIRITPPLTISMEELSKGCDIILEILDNILEKC